MKWIIRIAAVIGFIVVLSFLLLYKQPVNEPDGSVLFSGFLVLERVKEYPLEAMVTEPTQKIGIALEEYELDYGYVPVYSNVTKYINIWNQGSPSKIHMEVVGNISRFILFDDNDFVLEGEREVSVTLNSWETGNFSGVLKVFAKKPKSRWFDWMLPLI